VFIHCQCGVTLVTVDLSAHYRVDRCVQIINIMELCDSSFALRYFTLNCITYNVNTYSTTRHRVPEVLQLKSCKGNDIAVFKHHVI
jgi:hypothetical protein